MQHRVLQTLEVKKIPFEPRDIATDAANKREFKRLMRGYSDIKSAQLLPQIFSNDKLCGVCVLASINEQWQYSLRPTKPMEARWHLKAY